MNSEIFKSAFEENVKRLSDKNLLQQMENLSKHERTITIFVLRHLREIECRRLFVDLGFSSMYEYCVKNLKYSEGQTQRRLSAARLMTELPEIEMQIRSGDLNVTNLSKFQSFARAEKSADQPLSKKQKLDMLSQIQNKSTREVEKDLVRNSHQPALLAEKFHLTASSLNEINGATAQLEDQSFVRFDTVLNKELQDLLENFKNLYAHELSDVSNFSVLRLLLKKAVQQKTQKLTPKDSKERNAPLPSAPEAPTKRTNLRKYIGIATKRKIWNRASGQCEHHDHAVRCPSKFALQIDHIESIALGGSNDATNLRLLCRAHNSRRAVKTFGIFRDLSATAINQ